MMKHRVYVGLLAVPQVLVVLSFALLQPGEGAFSSCGSSFHVAKCSSYPSVRKDQSRYRPWRTEGQTRLLSKEGDGNDFSIPFPDDVSGSLATLVTPLATELDAIATEDDGKSLKAWVFSYADLTPENEATPAGALFLATNIAYAIAGIWLNLQGDVALGLGSELASIASFSYHYSQLSLGPKQPLVRVALLVDYIFAFAAVGIAADYLWTTTTGVTTETFVVMAAALACFAASWVKEGNSYLLFHGLWHVLGAYGGFLLGEAHLGLNSMA